MLAPAPPIPPAPLAPVGISSTASFSPFAPARTALKMHTSQLNVLEGASATFSGTLVDAHHAGLARRMVVLQTLGSHGWRTQARARTGARGRFRLSYVAHALGSKLIRVRFAGDALDLPTRKRLGTLNVYRLAGASWYGGGGGLACGGTLTSATLGVANKTLPCGTLVTLRYGGRSIRVPVIDRGPFVAGREFDLTEATKQALGFGDTGDVWSTR
jgi:rare lipoprotein A